MGDDGGVWCVRPGGQECRDKAAVVGVEFGVCQGPELKQQQSRLGMEPWKVCWARPGRLWRQKQSSRSRASKLGNAVQRNVVGWEEGGYLNKEEDRKRIDVKERGEARREAAQFVVQVVVMN